MISFTLKSFSVSVLAPGMPNDAYNVLFLIFCAGNRFKHGKPMVNNNYKDGEMNRTIIVIIAIYSTYLSKWCTTIPNDLPILF